MTDHGIGIDEGDRNRLFTENFRSQNAESRSLNKKSHGLGLSISKRIAENLGGNLILDDERRDGCKFILTLYLTKKLEPASPTL